MWSFSNVTTVNEQCSCSLYINVVFIFKKNVLCVYYHNKLKSIFRISTIYRIDFTSFDSNRFQFPFLLRNLNCIGLGVDARTLPPSYLAGFRHNIKHNIYNFLQQSTITNSIIIHCEKSYVIKWHYNKLTRTKHLACHGIFIFDFLWPINKFIYYKYDYYIVNHNINI